MSAYPWTTPKTLRADLRHKSGKAISCRGIDQGPNGGPGYPSFHRLARALIFPHSPLASLPRLAFHARTFMTLTAHEAWSRLLDRARQELPEQTFKTWLEPTEALSLDEHTIYVGAPDQFAADWNESKHSDMLASLAPIALGHPMSVVFKVSE